jgi:hypothetical protein
MVYFPLWPCRQRSARASALPFFCSLTLDLIGGMASNLICRALLLGNSFSRALCFGREAQRLTLKRCGSHALLALHHAQFARRYNLRIIGRRLCTETLERLLARGRCSPKPQRVDFLN